MKFRRILSDDSLQHQVLGSTGDWEDTDVAPLPSAFTPEFEVSLAKAHVAAGGGCLPFQPLSFRDFMASRHHVIDASRGLLTRFHPREAAVTRAVESLTHKPFPKFAPHALFDRQPIYYMSNHLTFVPSGTAVRAPAYTKALDYELELGFVLRTGLRDATPEQATDAIGAFVVLNDFSARDVQRAEMATGLGPQKSKHFASSMSQVAATADEILPQLDSLSGSVSINGRVVSRVDTSDQRWTVGEMLAHASKSETLLPGELFATGTLAGGSGMETGNWLRDGDVLTLELHGIGTIEHAITQHD
ncbi:fumarylacetoacetase [Mycobacterium sp. CBMA 234]|uniref:fumarylacetoacetate hydrolase family protein n=1 Tax=Mycolicibacterium sp. CBMA 234 TaxID=1918495 RepID=UPI0012DD2972|nr:fumarylacetoacetate hydrolase family protein [Mycolicibacterium sp. CBMA 234]MUL63034.1 fumarylacetoacetase [Mycolicibacterium sp. CBMA 234]